MGVTTTWNTKNLVVLLILLCFKSRLVNCSTYINADAVQALTERTLGKGNQFDIELSFENLDGTPCQNCTVCSITTDVHALYDGNPRTQLCTKCDVAETCPEDYYVHADLTFDNRWPMNYYKLTSSQNSGKDPQEVWLKGSRNGGQTWFELDHQSTISWSARKQDKTFTFRNVKYFTKYRLTMRKGTDSNKSSNMEMSGYEFASDFLSKFVTDLIYNVLKIQYFQPDIITLYQNFRVGEITEPAKNYEISCVIHPFDVVPSFRALFRFTSNPKYNSNYYGARVPLVAMANDKGTGRELTAFMDSRYVTSQNMYTKHLLELNKNNRIKFVVLGDKTRLYLNDQVVAAWVIPESERPNFSRLYAYTSDQYYTPAPAQLKHLVYSPIDINLESVPIKFKPSTMKVIKNVKIGTIIEPHHNFQLSFKFNPSSTTRATTSILRLTTDATGSLDTDDGHRIPFIGFFPDSYNLLWNYGLTESNRHWQYPAVLVPKMDNKIKIVVLDDNMNLYINDIFAGSLPYPLVNRPFYDKIYAFASDNVLKEASGTLSYVTYVPLHVNTQVTRFLTAPSINGMTRYNRIGYVDQMPTSEYVISAVIFPYKKSSNNGYSIFRFSSVSNANNDKTMYGSRSPMLHYQSCCDGTLKPGMSIVSKTESAGTVKEQSIGFKNKINEYEQTSVTLVSIDNEIALYINGVLVDSATAPLVERPPFKRLYVFTSTSYQDFFRGKLKHLEYTPIYKSNQIVFQPTGSTLRLHSNKYLGTVINPRLTNLYEITFTLLPYGTYNDWTSILRFTRPNGEDTSKYGDRAPALWFVPSTRRIHLAHGSTEDPARYFQTEAALIYNQESNIRIITREDGIISLYVNDQPAGSMYIPLASRPPINTLQVHASDNFYRAASADISHLTYRHIYANAGNEFLLSRGLKPKRNNVIGEIANPSAAFIISCVIHPLGVVNAWSNVFRFSRVSPTDKSVYGDRYVSLWMHPNTYNPRLHMGTMSDAFGIIQENTVSFIANKDNDFRIEVNGNGIMKMYINDAVAGFTHFSPGDYPPLERLMVYVSDPFYSPANVLVRQLKYAPVFSKDSVYKFLHSTLTVQRNNLLAIIQDPSPTYTISCTIHPNGINNDWASIFRFSRVALTDVDFYGDRSPALLVKPKTQACTACTYDLLLAQGSTINPNHNVHVTTGLNEGRDNTVKIVSGEDGRITIYVNNIQSGSAHIPLSNRPDLDKLLVYVGDPYYHAANAQVSNLFYEPMLAQEPVVKLLPSFIQPERLNLIGIISKPSNHYIITATIKPFATSSTITQYFTFKVKPFESNKKYGDRFPTLFVEPNTLKIFVQYRVTTENAETTRNPPVGLVLHRENEVRIESIGEIVTLYINDNEVSSVTIPMEKRPTLIKPLYVFSCDGDYAGAKSYIKDLIYTPLDPKKLTSFTPSVIAITKNNKVGQVIKPSSQYVISSTIRPLGTVDGWGCLFRFTQNAESNAENYGDRNPLLMFHSGNYDLYSNIMFMGQNNYKNVYNMKGIIVNQDNDVKIVAAGNEISYFVNDEKVGTMLAPISDRPQIDLLHVFASDNFYNAANAEISNLVFSPINPDGPIAFYPNTIVIKKNNKVGEILTTSNNFKINFVIQPSGIKSGLSSILRLGRTFYKDKDFYGDRAPAFFFNPGTLKLLVAQGCTRNFSNEMQSLSTLGINKDNIVKLISFEDTLTLYINDVKEGSMIVPLANRPLLEEMQVYVGDEFYDEANAVIKDLVYTPIKSKHNPINPINLLPASLTLVQKKFGDIYNSNSQYIISFGIKPLGIVANSWSNILRFTTNPLTDSGYGSRNPALFFHPDSYDLQLSLTTTEGTTGINSMKGLVENEETDVKIVALGHLIKVYFNDIKVGEIYSPLWQRPHIDYLEVNCASTDIVSNAEISNLVYTPIPDIITDPFYPVAQGYCLNGNGVGQNGGDVDLGDLKAGTWTQQQKECKERCIAEVNKGVTVTGCEANKSSRKCWLHNQSVAKGNGDTNYSCWVAGAPMPFKFEQGICVESNGSHANGSYHRTFLGLANNNNLCMRKCIEYYDQSTDKANVSGCQRDYNDNKCHVYHLSSYIVVGGQGSSGNMCFVKDNFECSGDKCKCGSSDILQEDYRGNISRTRQGVPCQRWDTRSPHNHSYNPKSYGLDGNYCRNPGKHKIRPWCYTTDPSKQWDYCDVPTCPCGTLSKRRDDYRGDLSTTTSGRTCQAWNSQTVHTHDRTSPNYPTAGLESNFCRNPGSKSTTWCYTTDPNVPFDACNVPTCDPIMKVRIYVNALYNICDRDGWRDKSDAYVKVYVNGRYCGRTSTHWDKNPTYFRQYFYCGTHNRWSSLKTRFYAYDQDSGSDDYLGATNNLYNSEKSYSSSANFYGGQCGSGSMYLKYSTLLY